MFAPITRYFTLQEITLLRLKVAADCVRICKKQVPRLRSSSVRWDYFARVTSSTRDDDSFHPTLRREREGWGTLIEVVLGVGDLATHSNRENF